MTSDQQPLPNPQPGLVWQDTASGAVPVATRFGDPYFSLSGGLAEARHVFLAGNDLPERFLPGFQIAELGFGTGRNMLAALLAWRASGSAGPLRFTSFEAFPLAGAHILRALGPFAELEDLAAPFARAWDACDMTAAVRRFVLPGLIADVVVGDARDSVPTWQGRADAWFLDGFAPARNPEMWDPALLAAVAARTVPGGTCASYSAAGSVRRGLTAAGFAVTRGAGFAGKRHMTAGRLAS